MTRVHEMNRALRLAERKALAAERRLEVKRLAEADTPDAEIAELLGISKRHAKTLRISVGELKTKRRPRQIGWTAVGLRISNLPDREIAELYRGARYG